MRVYKFFSRVGLLLVLWWVLVEANPASLVFGAVAAVAASYLSLTLYPVDQAGIRAWRLVPLLGWLCVQGLRGGLDVAWRAIHPRLPVDPAWTKVRLTSDHAAANSLLGGMISVLPGSLAAGPANGVMDLHLLHGPSFDLLEFERDQRRVLGLFDRRIESAGPFDA